MSPPCARRASATRPSARTNGVTCDRRRRDGPVPERARDAAFGGAHVHTLRRRLRRERRGRPGPLGGRAAIVSRVGADGHGDYVRAWLASEGIDVRFLATDPYWLTPPTFCEVWPPDRFPITFYRRPTAPDWQLAPGDFAADELAGATLL